MGAQQSQQGQQEKKKTRKRDIFMGMCMSQTQPTNAAVKLRKSLSENMKQSSMDILTQSIKQISKLSDEEMPKYSIKIIQYFFNFLTIQDCISLKLVNRKLKFMVEMSSSIYSNYLSQFYLRKIQLPCFVEYGLDQRFISTFSEQLTNIETNQDDSWVRIYDSFQKSMYKLDNSIRFIEDEILKKYHTEYHLAEKLIDVCRTPILPFPILTDDVLKQSTTSWFQLEMASNHKTDTSLDDLIEKLYVDCLGLFSVDNLIHTQIMFELRWVVLDNFIKDPSLIQDENIPALFRLVIQVLHFLYQRCLFSRNVLMIMKSQKNPTQFLNMYSLLWESFTGLIWTLNRAFKKIFIKLDQLFNHFFQTEFPQISFTSAIGRMWTQVVIKGTKNQQIDPIENELIQSFDAVLTQKRKILFGFFMKDQVSNLEQKPNFEDKYFKFNSGALDYLLNRVTSDILDISLHEQSINWIGHSQLKIGSIYAQILEQVVKQSNQFYNQASQLLSTDFNTFKDYIKADTRYLQQILNTWTVQVCIFPIGLDYLYQKVKINLRQHVLNCQFNDKHEENNAFEENVLESKILTSNYMIKLSEPDELSFRIEKEESLLELVICSILQEEKDLNSQHCSRILQQTNQYQQQSIAQPQYWIANSLVKQQSIVEDCGKHRMLSTFSNSTRVSQVTCLTSVISQQLLSSVKSNQNMYQVKEIKNKLENNNWALFLKDIQVFELENQIAIEKRNNQVEMRNFIRQIPQELPEQINNNVEFTKVWTLEDTMVLCEKITENPISQYEKTDNFSEIVLNQGLFASCFLQQN